MEPYPRRFALAFAALAALIAFGTAGYHILERWSFDDALYMTVITLTAVGFQEVRPLTESGRTFTMVLLLGGITWMGGWFALVTSLLVELDLTDARRKRRQMKRIAKMHDHVIVCGGGRTGRQVIDELESMDTPWVLIERDSEQAEAFGADRPDSAVVIGDATHDDTLREAGLERARGLVTCLSADADNLFVCLSAREQAPDCTIVARAWEEETMAKLYRAGASHVVSPNVSGAVRMASVLVRPSVVSFLDIATRSSDLELRMEQIEIGSRSPLAGRPLAEARIPDRTGLIVIAMRKHDLGGDGRFVFNPMADTRAEPGDHLVVLGTEDQITRLRAIVGS